ncbi:MAG: type II CAAX endopeptidase family protein [Terracoccus sp.]
MIRRRPLVAFFSLAMGLSWLLWLPYVLSNSGLGVLDFDYPKVLGLTQLVGVMPGAYAGPLSAAFLVTAIAEGRPGLRAWRRRLTHWRVGWRWYLAVLVGVPAALLVSALVVPGAWAGIAVPSVMALAVYLPLLAVQMVTTAAAEEPGWRDYALPRLQRRYGPVQGTVVLGVMWGVSHLLLFLTKWGGGPGVAWWHPVVFVATCVPLSLVMTWLFNRTSRGLPLIMVFHASINNTMSVVWTSVFPGVHPEYGPTLATSVAASVGAAAVLLATRGRLGMSVAEVDEIPAERASTAEHRSKVPALV